MQSAVPLARALLAAMFLTLLSFAPAAAQDSGNVVAIPPGGQDRGEDAVGPDSLRDFSLDPADNARPPARPDTPPATDTPPETAPSFTPTPLPRPARPAVRGPVARSPETPPPDIRLPPLDEGVADPPRVEPDVGPVPIEPRGLGSDNDIVPSVGLAPWWAFALLPLLLVGAVFMLLRRRRAAPASATEEALVPPTATGNEEGAQPTPALAPAPQPAPEPTPSDGLVTTRLAPDLRLEVVPVRAALEEATFWIDYRMQLANDGTGPAHGVRVDTAILMAGPDQDKAIAAFEEHPDLGKGAPAVPVLRPGETVGLQGRAHLPLEKARVVKMDDRQLFLPMLAFAMRRNASEASEVPVKAGSSAYLIGRSGGAEGKMAPIRIDKGPRLFRDTLLKRL